MSIYGPSEFKVRYNGSFVAKFDKLTDGKSVSDFTGVLPDYYTNVYAFNEAAEANYNFKWSAENVDVAEFVGGVWIKNNEGPFTYVAKAPGYYYFRTHSPLTIWEEAVTGSNAVMPVADVGVTKVADKAKYYVGDKVVYTITVTNNGPDIAFDVVAKDVLPKGMKLVSAKASQGTYENGVWDIGDLAKGDKVTLIINMVAEKNWIS